MPVLFTSDQHILTVLTETTVKYEYNVADRLRQMNLQYILFMPADHILFHVLCKFCMSFQNAIPFPCPNLNHDVTCVV